MAKTRPQRTDNLAFLLRAGESQSAVELYRTFRKPSAIEQRLCGSALVTLGQHHEAEVLLNIALERGEASAAIDLAAISRFHNEFSAALRLIETLLATDPEPEDHMCAMTELAAIHMYAGDNQSCITAAREALTLQQQHGLYPPYMAYAWLGHSLILQGQTERGFEYLGTALSSSSMLERARVLCLRARASLLRAAYTHAVSDLQEAARLAEYVPVVLPFVRYVEGLWYRTCGYFTEAARSLTDAVDLAASIQDYNTAWWSSLYLTMTEARLGQRDDTVVAYQSILRFHRDDTPALTARLSFARGIMLAVHNDLSAPSHFEAAMQEHLRSDRVQEAGYCLFHIIEFHLWQRTRSATIQQYGKQMYALLERTGGMSAFASEFRSFPRVIEAFYDYRSPVEMYRELSLAAQAVFEQLPSTATTVLRLSADGLVKVDGVEVTLTAGTLEILGMLAAGIRIRDMKMGRILDASRELAEKVPGVLLSVRLGEVRLEGFGTMLVSEDVLGGVHRRFLTGASLG